MTRMLGSPENQARVYARRAAGKPLDDNDLAVIGELPDDPSDGCISALELGDQTPEDIAEIERLVKEKMGA